MANNSDKAPQINIVQHLVETLMRENSWSETSKVARLLGESPMTVGRWRHGGWVSFEKLQEALERVGGDVWWALPPRLRPEDHPGFESGTSIVGRVHANNSFVVSLARKPRHCGAQGLESLVSPDKWALGRGPVVLFDTDGGAIKDLPAGSWLLARAFAEERFPENTMLVLREGKAGTHFLAQKLQRFEAEGTKVIATFSPEPIPQPTLWSASSSIEVTHVVCGAFTPF